MNPLQNIPGGICPLLYPVLFINPVVYNKTRARLYDFNGLLICQVVDNYKLVF